MKIVDTKVENMVWESSTRENNLPDLVKEDDINVGNSCFNKNRQPILLINFLIQNCIQDYRLTNEDIQPYFIMVLFKHSEMPPTVNVIGWFPNKRKNTSFKDERVYILVWTLLNVNSYNHLF